MNKVIGIVIAMESELRPYLTEKTTEVVIGGKTFYKTVIGNKEAVIVFSGIGKVNAAYACTLLCREFSPEFIVTTGLSGGLGRSNVLDTVVATATCQHDSDTTALGDPIGLISTVNKIYFPADEKLTDLFCRLTGAKKGVFACGDQFVADKEKARKIVENFDAVACDMESSAVAYVARLSGMRFAVIRRISDDAGDNATDLYKEMNVKDKMHWMNIVFDWINTFFDIPDLWISNDTAKVK